MRRRRVLLVCSGNTCRSPMAAALLLQLWQQSGSEGDLEVISAGTGAFPGVEATGNAVEAMRKRGLDISGHRSRTVTDETLAGVDLVLTMTDRHKGYLLTVWPDLQEKVYTLGEYSAIGTDVSDPFGGTLQEYERTAEMLVPMLEKVVERLRREGTAVE